MQLQYVPYKIRFNIIYTTFEGQFRTPPSLEINLSLKK